MATQPEIVEQLFEAALALKPTEREAFLDQACSHDPQLRLTVEELLAEDAKAGSLLEHPPFDFLRATGTTGSFDENQVSSPAPSAGRLKPGQVLLDRFVIVRFIASGGMGEVYEAEDGFLQDVHVALRQFFLILPMIRCCSNDSSARSCLPGKLATRIYAPSMTSFIASSRRLTSCS